MNTLGVTETLVVIFVGMLVGFLLGLLIGVNTSTPIINENRCIHYQTDRNEFYIHHIEKKEISKEDRIYEFTLRCYQKGELK